MEQREIILWTENRVKAHVDFYYTCIFVTVSVSEEYSLRVYDG